MRHVVKGGLKRLEMKTTYQIVSTTVHLTELKCCAT